MTHSEPLWSTNFGFLTLSGNHSAKPLLWQPTYEQKRPSVLAYQPFSSRCPVEWTVVSWWSVWNVHIQLQVIGQPVDQHAASISTAIDCLVISVCVACALCRCVLDVCGCIYFSKCVCDEACMMMEVMSSKLFWWKTSFHFRGTKIICPKLRKRKWIKMKWPEAAFQKWGLCLRF